MNISLHSIGFSFVLELLKNNGHRIKQCSEDSRDVSLARLILRGQSDGILFVTTVERMGPSSDPWRTPPLSLVFICPENRRRSGVLLFADHPRLCRNIEYSPEVCPRFSRKDTFICDRGTGAQQFRELVMSEIHRRRTPTSPTVQI